MTMLYREYELSRASVDAVSDDVQAYLDKQRMESRSVQRIRLTVEELLINMLEHYGSGMKFSIGLGKQFGRHMFRLRYQAEAFDPSENSDNPLADEMMRSLGLSPVWSCRREQNTVSIILAQRPKRSTLANILIAAITAVLLGVIGGFIPESVRMTVNDSLLTPFSNSYLALLNTFAGLMIFLTICSGILGMGDPEALGRTGRSVVVRFVGISFVISVAAVIATLPFVKLNMSSAGVEQSSAFTQISQMFFDILPSNIIDPFRTGNTFHIIVIALFTGCGLLAVGERGSHVREVINEASLLAQQIVSFICSLIPLYIFSVLLTLIWSKQESVLASVLKPIIMITIGVIVLAVIVWIRSSLRLKCSPIVLMKKVLPAFMVAFTSASSISAFQIGTETCEKKLGVNKSLTSFVYPLGSVIYMPSSVIYFTVLICTFAEIYQTPVSLSWLIMAVMIATLITIAMPPVPGGDILCYTVLFSSLGIPMEAIVLATAVGIVLDYLDTGTNVLLLIFRIACEAKRLGKQEQGIQGTRT